MTLCFALRQQSATSLRYSPSGCHSERIFVIHQPPSPRLRLSIMKLPLSGSPASQFVRYGEHRAREAFAKELEPFYALSIEIVDVAGDLVDRIARHPGEMTSIHVAALLLARIQSDLRAVMHLLRHGYAAQAMTVVGTMLELTHVMAYIGRDEARASAWLAWADPKKSYPGSIADTIRAVAQSIGAPAEAIEREYDVIYRQVCQVKHGNTRALPIANSAVSGDSAFIVMGPVATDEARRLALASAQWATRYGLLANLAFISSHVAGQEQSSLAARMQKHADVHEVLGARLTVVIGDEDT